jgi:hypothetical protein
VWGAPRIHGELLKLGVEVSSGGGRQVHGALNHVAVAIVAHFLANHVQQVAAADFFVVPTATCRLLSVLVILAHERSECFDLNDRCQFVGCGWKCLSGGGVFGSSGRLRSPWAS